MGLCYVCFSERFLFSLIPPALLPWETACLFEIRWKNLLLPQENLSKVINVYYFLYVLPQRYLANGPVKTHVHVHGLIEPKGDWRFSELISVLARAEITFHVPFPQMPDFSKPHCFSGQVGAQIPIFFHFSPYIFNYLPHLAQKSEPDALSAPYLSSNIVL